MTKQIKLVRRDDKGLEPEMTLEVSRVPVVGELVLVPVALHPETPMVYRVDGVAHRASGMGQSPGQWVEALVFATKKADGEPKPQSWLPRTPSGVTRGPL